MNRSEQIDALAEALSIAQGQFPTIPRDKKVKVTMKSGGTYTFAYAPLDTILEKIRPVLAANGLSVLQNCSATGTSTIIMHKSGQWIETDPLHIEPLDRSPQSIGSSTTYEQRYQLRACLLLPVDDDDDANIASGNTVTDQKKDSTPHLPPKPQPDASGDDTALISDAQAKRFWAIAKSSGKTEDEIKGYYKQLGIEHTKDIPKRYYESACAWAEAK
jgi:hypothetical protein